MDDVNIIDATYAALLNDVLAHGEHLTTRNAPVRRRIAQTLVFEWTPLVCARKTAWKTAIREMAWFLSGSDRLADAHPSVWPWWEPWADADGRVRSNYSVQLRDFHGKRQSVDQVEYLIAGVRDHPNSRRNVITTWNTADMTDPETPITNCWGTVIQAFVGVGGLSLVTYQRSVDAVCGLPHNLVQMWAFLLWLAHRTGNRVDSLTWIGGDVHVYEEHVGLATEIVLASARTPPAPDLVYRPTSEAFLADDFSLSGEYRPTITASARMVV